MQDRPGGEIQQVAFEKKRGVASLSVVPNLMHVLVILPHDPEECTQCQLKVFRALAETGIPIYLIKLHDGYLSFVIEKGFENSAQDVLKKLNSNFKIFDSMAIVSVIAANMRDSFGIMARIVEAMLTANVKIVQTGDSHNSVSCLISSDQIPMAVAALQKEFGLPEADFQTSEASEK